MSPAVEQLASSVAIARSRISNEIRSAVLLAIVTAALLYFIRWPSLQPGLAIIVASRLIIAFALFRRNRAYRKTLDDVRRDRIQGSSVVSWFDGEERFLKRVKFFYAGPVVGVMILAYGFWMQTGSLWIAIALGLVYPASITIGIWRMYDVRGIRTLRRQRIQIQALLAAGEPR
jgi:hypothetical protein